MTRTSALIRFRRIMSLITVGTPIGEVLEAIIQAVEEEAPDVACSIYLLDHETKWLHLAAAPRIGCDQQALRPVPSTRCLIGAQRGSVWISSTITRSLRKAATGQEPTSGPIGAATTVLR